LFAENALRIEVFRGSATEVLEVQADRALVGSGAHCDLRLSPDEAAVEHLTIEARDDEVHAAVRALHPACRLNGAPFLEGRLSPDSMLELPGVALRVTLTELKERKAPQAKSSAQTHPVVQGIGLLGVAAGLVFALQKPAPPESVLAQAVEPPTLFAGALPTCPQSAREAAASLASEELLDAESKAERAPFYPSDGLSAVHLYERVAACLRVAGDKEHAEDASKAAERLKRELKDELHLHHVRLERLLEKSKYEESARELSLVSAYVEDKNHPYAHWLSAVKRELELHNNVREGG
jgi:hypothetical protein